MSDWITTAGTTEAPTSNTLPEEKRGQVRYEVGGGAVEVRTPFDGTEGKVISSRNIEYTAGEDHGYQGSVIGSARTEGGSVIVSRSVTAQDRVTLPEGITTSAAVAAQLGYLVRNPDGSFSDAQRPEPIKNPVEVTQKTAPEAKPESKPTEPTSFRIGDEGEAALTAINETVMPGDAIKAMDETLQLGEVSENTLARMASVAGIEPDQMREQINAAHQGFYDAATAHMAARGVTNEDAFGAFLAQNPYQMEKMVASARALAMTNDTSGLDDVTDAFLEQADRFMVEDVKVALEEAGYQYQDGPNGRLLVNIEGAQVPWNVAVRQRLIRFSN